MGPTKAYLSVRFSTLWAIFLVSSNVWLKTGNAGILIFVLVNSTVVASSHWQRQALTSVTIKDFDEIAIATQLTQDHSRHVWYVNKLAEVLNATENCKWKILMQYLQRALFIYSGKSSYWWILVWGKLWSSSDPIACYDLLYFLNRIKNIHEINKINMNDMELDAFQVWNCVKTGFVKDDAIARLRELMCNLFRFWIGTFC